MAISALPGSQDHVAHVVRYGQPVEHFFTGDDVADHVHAHIVQFLARGLDFCLDFVKRKDVSGVIDPIGFTVHFMKAKADGARFLAPVGSGRNAYAFHINRCC